MKKITFFIAAIILVFSCAPSKRPSKTTTTELKNKKGKVTKVVTVTNY